MVDFCIKNADNASSAHLKTQSIITDTVIGKTKDRSKNIVFYQKSIYKRAYICYNY